MVTAVYLPEKCLRAFSARRILCAFHDVDGTHSLIRDWPPVMSAVLNDVVVHGLPEGFDSRQNVLRLIDLCGKKSLPETDAFCTESAGLSALTQMEWAIRRGIQEKVILLAADDETNDEIIRRIWRGEETFPDLPEREEVTGFLRKNTPRLFRLYEEVLNGYCRNRNLLQARTDPKRFLVKGSLAFLSKLHSFGVKNFFVTGAVVERGKGMYEEVETLGFSIGHGCVVEDIIGSTWAEKLPKREIMHKLQAMLGVPGEQILVTGDGRSEIGAGVEMGALTVSRLNEKATRQRELHRELGTSLIVEDFSDPFFGGVLRYTE